MDIRDKFTLVVPTFNRYNLLFRLLKYYESFGFPFRIKILDSSTNKEKPPELILLLQNENIYYQEFESSIRVASKINIGVSTICTRFSALCADDDFLVPNGIEQSIKFLEKNNEYSVTQGVYISFFNNPEKTIGIEWRKIYKIRSIEQCLPSERIHDFLSNYSMSVFYGVHRKELLNSIWGATCQETDDDRFSELLPAMLSAVSGKIKVLNILFSARQIDSQSGGHILQTISDFKKNHTYVHKYNKFKECIILNLQKTESISYKKAKKVVDKAMNNYMGSLTDKIKTYLVEIIENSFLLNKYYEIYKNNKKNTDPGFFVFNNLENPFKPDLDRIELAIKNKFLN